MSKIFISVLLQFIFIDSFGQTVKLYQTRSADDFIVTNGSYSIYFIKEDIQSAIIAIDTVIKENHSETYKDIGIGVITSIDMNSATTNDKDCIDLFSTNLGAYLLMRGKAVVIAGTRNVNEIVADFGPYSFQSDGKTLANIFFSEPGSDIPIFIGELNTMFMDEK